MQTKEYAIGMVGLGVMGRNLLLNMADHGFAVAGYDTDASKVESLTKEAEHRAIFATKNIQDFVHALQEPRAIILLVPAGAAVDAVVQALLPFLNADDMIIDAGNSYFKDTDRRIQSLTAQNMHFLGVGISGGEAGARHGPSIMPGGDKNAYQRIEKIFAAISAQVENSPCVTYLGPGSAGHFVKMVHNGIEYGIMQLISETYALMKNALQFNNAQLAEIYTKWNQGKLKSYLLEITSHIFNKQDDKTNHALIDQITPVAAQKGTGMWTSQIAMELQVPIPTIDIAVSMRDLSGFVEERETASKIYKISLAKLNIDSHTFVHQLEDAFYAAMIMVYAQGMALLKVASTHYSYNLKLEDIAKIWRGGCIIRSVLLEDICAAFHADPNLANLLLDANLSQQLLKTQESLRQMVLQIAELGIAAPAFMQSLSYFDAYRSAWLPANLIQAQRDYFGSHTYTRIDSKGVFHTEWEQL